MFRSRTPLAVTASLAFLPFAIAQAPSFAMNAASPITSQGGQIQSYVEAPVGSLYAVWIDIDGGPVPVLGEQLLLGATPLLSLFDGGLVPTGNIAFRGAQLPLFPGMLGLVVYGQALVLDVTAPNGLFRATNGASTAFHGTSQAYLETFDLLNGFTGTFASDLVGHVRGAPVTRRTIETVLPGSYYFPAPIAAPLVPFGCRAQYVYRAQDVGATGAPELLTAVRWRTVLNVVPDTFPAFDFRVGHTDVVPDYSVDPWSALPVAPNSGLSPTFANNERPGAPPVPVFQGSYTIDPLAMLPSGYLPFPMSVPFAYDGVSSLLLDFRVPPGLSQGGNGMTVWLQVQSDYLPGARVVRSGTAVAPILPDQVATGQPDNALPELQLEFTRVASTLRSPWQFANPMQLAYDVPIVARSLPPGTSIALRYRGSTNGTDAGATAWSDSPSVANGLFWLQYEITFRSNALTGDRPIVDSLVLPQF